MDIIRNTNISPRPAGKPTGGSPAPSHPGDNSSRRFTLSRPAVIAIIVAVILLCALAWWFCIRGQQHIMSDRYQAVHLENGQVFFGKLQNTSGEFLTLRDAYYTPLQQPKPAGEQETPTQLSLIRVGEEVYGPEQSVSIARSTVQYWENLRSDSKVIDAIKQQQ